MITKTVTFETWPVWNYHFPELDVLEIVSVQYFDNEGALQLFDEDLWRKTIGQSGVSGIRFLQRNRLPELNDKHKRPDRVTITYTISDDHELLSQTS